MTTLRNGYVRALIYATTLVFTIHSWHNASAAKHIRVSNNDSGGFGTKPVFTIWSVGVIIGLGLMIMLLVNEFILLMSRPIKNDESFYSHDLTEDFG